MEPIENILANLPKPKDDSEDFLHFESKVNQVIKMMEEMSQMAKTDAEQAKGDNTVDWMKLGDHVTEDNFLLVDKDNRTLINKRKSVSANAPVGPDKMNKFTFMRQLETDANERAKVREERQQTAQNFRAIGNDHFRKGKYELAIINYTRAIEFVKDSPILYNNRALSYLKLRNFKRCLMDCDYVINKLEEKNLRSWLYRAAAFKRMGDEFNFVSSVKFAKKYNSKETDYIDSFVSKIQQIC